MRHLEKSIDYLHSLTGSVVSAETGLVMITDLSNRTNLLISYTWRCLERLTDFLHTKVSSDLPMSLVGALGWNCYSTPILSINDCGKYLKMSIDFYSKIAL